MTFTLEKDGDQVLLTVTHARLSSRAELVEVAAGRHTYLDLLRDSEPGPFWPIFTALRAEYDAVLP